MSATYALLDLVFLAVIAVVGIVAAVVAARRTAAADGRAAVAPWLRATLVTGIVVGVVLLVMTIVFDNVIVGLGVVAYDAARISGLSIGLIPVEDLGYAVGAVVLLPSLWVLCARPRRVRSRSLDRALSVPERRQGGRSRSLERAVSGPERPRRVRSRSLHRAVSGTERAR